MKHRHHGLMLVELFAVLILTGAALLIGSQLFKSILDQTRDLPAAEVAMLTQQSMLDHLRRDVWAANAITRTDTGVRLSLGDGTAVDWSVDTEGTVLRGTDRRWARVGSGAIWQIEGPTLVLRWPGSELRLVSQVMLAARQAPAGGGQ